MALGDDSHIEWQLFVDGPASLEDVVGSARAAFEGDFNFEPFIPYWKAPGYRLWNQAMLVDVVDGHPYETDGKLDFDNFRFLVDLEDQRRPGDGQVARRFAHSLFDRLRSAGAHRLLLVSDLQGLVRDYDTSRERDHA